MQHQREELQARLVTCQVARDASKRQLKRAMMFAEELVAEQEKLLHQLHAKQEENNSIARLGTTLVYRMGSLKTKLKVGGCQVQSRIVCRKKINLYNLSVYASRSCSYIALH